MENNYRRYHIFIQNKKNYKTSSHLNTIKMSNYNRKHETESTHASVFCLVITASKLDQQVFSTNKTNKKTIFIWPIYLYCFFLCFRQSENLPTSGQRVNAIILKCHQSSRRRQIEKDNARGTRT